MKAKNKLRQFRPSRWWSNITALRVDANITEKELSSLLGKSDNYIFNATRNGGAPNIADAILISDLFDTTVEELAFGAVGLEIRKKQLQEELKKITEEIEDVKKDLMEE